MTAIVKNCGAMHGKMKYGDKCPGCGKRKMGKKMVVKRDVGMQERSDLASEGAAMPDGSYPIASLADLENAVQAYGRAKDKPAVKAHIIKQAQKFGRIDLLPEGWQAEIEKVDPVRSAAAKKGWETRRRKGLVGKLKSGDAIRASLKGMPRSTRGRAAETVAASIAGRKGTSVTAGRNKRVGNITRATKRNAASVRPEGGGKNKKGPRANAIYPDVHTWKDDELDAELAMNQESFVLDGDADSKRRVIELQAEKARRKYFPG